MSKTTNHDRFWDAFRVALAANMVDRPQDYMPNVPAGVIADKMRDAANRKGIRGININSLSFTHACKAVGIKRTYAAIDEYLNGEQQ